MSADITRVREWEDADGHELEDPNDPKSGWRWPAPPQYVESHITGNLKRQILTNLGRGADVQCTIRLIEGQIEGGYSEFTVEMDYEIEVWVDEGRQSQKVWGDDYSGSSESSLAKFLAWATPTEPTR